MRVTTKAYTNNFLKNNNTLLGNLLKSEEKILSQRKYNRASEDSVSAAKAAHVRKSLANLDIYDENCQTAKDFFYAAEDALYDVANKTYLNVYQKVVSIQDTKNQTELDIVAQEISELADHMIQDMNSDFAERQMFGCTSNDKTPFTTFSRVAVFDKDGNEIITLGNQPDTAELVGGGEIVPLLMNDPTFFDENGNALTVDQANALAAGTELYDKNGVLYPVTSDGNGGLVNVSGETVTAYTSTHSFYDENGKKIEDFVNFKGDTYYDRPMEEIDGEMKFSDDAVKFTVNGTFDKNNEQKDKIVCYNDVPINLEGEDLLKAVDGGRIVYYDAQGNLTDSKTVTTTLEPGTEGDCNAFPGSKPIYVDIGLGINYSKLDSTALDISLNGAKISGCGIDDDGDACNLMQLVYDAAAAMRNGDRETVNRLIDKIDDANTKVLNAITDLGIKQNNMDFYMQKNEVYRLSLLEKQNDLEGVDLEAEITNWKTIDAAYNAALSMGSNILPKSLFDFI